MRTRFGLGAGAVLLATVPVAVTPALAQTPAAPQPAAATTTATTTANAPATPARSSLRISSARRNVMHGERTLVKGRLRGGATRARVQLQRRSGDGWTTVARDTTGARGAFRLRYTPSSTGTLSMRVRFGGTSGHRRAVRSVGRVNVFRRAFASWYGPGLYGNKLGCGGTLNAGTLGVAHKGLPCGTKLTLRHGSRSVRVSVIDRGPYVGGREFDLTQATKQALGFGSTGTVLTTR